MPSTPSPRLRAELQALGENLNTWGDGRLNAALTRLEEAIADVVPIAVTGTSYVLTSTNYVADEARGAALVITGTLTGNTTITAPTVEKLYLIDNRTTQGAFSLTIKTAAGTGYALRPGPQWVFCDGSDFARGVPRLDQVPLPAAPVDMNAQRLTNLPTPANNSDAATKKYVDDTAFSSAGGNLPGQAGNATRVLTTDGAVASWGPLLPNPSASNRGKVLSVLAGGGGYEERQSSEAYWSGTVGGTANALTATTGASLSSLTRGQIIGLKTGASANSGASTLAVDAVAAVAIQKNGAALIGGELPANTDLLFQYDGAAFQLLGGTGSGGPFGGYVAKSADYPLAASDVGKLIDCTAALTLTLLSPSSALSGFSVGVANSSAVATVTLSGTVNGTSNVTLRPGDWALLVCTGSTWKALIHRISNVSTVTWSSSDREAGLNLINGNLTAYNSTSSVQSCRATQSLSGKQYWECRLDAKAASGLSAIVGVATGSAPFNGTNGLAAGAAGYGYESNNGTKLTNNAGTAFGASWNSPGIVIGIWYDDTSGTPKIWFGLNGIVQGGGDPVNGTSPAFTLAAGTYFPAMSSVNGGQVTARFSFQSWSYPAGNGYGQVM